jgi:hypothetical protein
LHRGTADAVLGPATDGGWWALGLRDPRAAAAIADVPTSRDDTGERTLDALRAAGLRVQLLPELTDVDTAADAVAVAGVAPWTRFAAAVAALPALRRVGTQGRANHPSEHTSYVPGSVVHAPGRTDSPVTPGLAARVRPW